MDIEIIEQPQSRLQVVIKCTQADEEVLRLKKYISLFDKKIAAKKDHQTYYISSSDVLYFESVNDRTFLYTQDHIFEVSRRLYELEYSLSDADFIRISKSQIVNLNKLKALKPELNRTILATLCNGEQLSISRKYVPAIRALLLL